MYNCVKCVHLCNSKFDGLILLVSLDFKTSWKMFTQRGEYVTVIFVSLVLAHMKQASASYYGTFDPQSGLSNS